MGKAITEELKKQISEFYRDSDMTNFEIAKALDVSPRSVRRYKNYDGLDQISPDYDIMAKPISQTCQTLEEPETPNQSNQNQIADETVEPDNIEYEAETTQNEVINPMITKVRKLESCPDCDTPKADWIQLDQLDEDDPPLTEEELQKYDYICPKCRELLSEYICPECGAPKSEWIPVSQYPGATEKEKRFYDYVCPKCNELIKIAD